MNNRIRELRKSSGMTLEAFGERIGVTRAAVSNIENGRSNPSDQLIRSICREFKVNEEWLRTGDGEMFLQESRSDLIASFMADVMGSAPNDARQVIVSGLAKLDVEDWETIRDILKKMGII